MIIIIIVIIIIMNAMIIWCYIKPDGLMIDGLSDHVISIKFNWICLKQAITHTCKLCSKASHKNFSKLFSFLYYWLTSITSEALFININLLSFNHFLCAILNAYFWSYHQIKFQNLFLSVKQPLQPFFFTARYFH